MSIRADINFYAPTPVGVDEAGDVITRSSFLNVGTQVEFKPIPAVGIFIGVNNLLNTQYQRWFNYPERGIDFRGGLTWAF
ncbi:MAG: hypothetical protein AAFY71_27700 [Bacteroidota bacterium]